MKKVQKEKAIDIFTFNVAWIRKENNISKKRMAEILGISIYTLNKIENGILPPKLKVDVIFNIKNYFNVPVNYILEKKLKK